jgi:hypothetical protein
MKPSVRPAQPVPGDRLVRMTGPQQGNPEFSDRHELVKTVCVWRDGACYRIEIIRRLGKPEQGAYAALLWLEEEQAGRRVLVRDVKFPWVHYESADAALDHAMEALAAKLRYGSAGETEA